jgi:RHS repeat-associated protein
MLLGILGAGLQAAWAVDGVEYLLGLTCTGVHIGSSPQQVAEMGAAATNAIASTCGSHSCTNPVTIYSVTETSVKYQSKCTGLIGTFPITTVLEPKDVGCKKELVGHPCDPATGNKFLAESDSTGPDSTGLVIKRTFNSHTAVNGTVGKLWRADFDSQLYPYISEEFGINVVSVRRPNGKTYQFQLDSGVWTPDADIRDQLLQTTTGWDYQLVDGSIEHYDSSGRLVGKTTPNGLTTSYTYAANGKLQQIVGPFGHSLTLTYLSNNSVSTITDDAGQVTQYLYNSANNLRWAKYPDNTAKVYSYENSGFPSYVTGVSYVDSNNVTTRYSTYAYDTTGKAIRTQLAQTDNGAPQEKFTLSYDSDTQTTVTDSASVQEIMTFAANLGVKHLISKVNQSDGKSVQQTFDTNNNLTCRKNEEGQVTTYSYNATNQKTGMTEGLTGDCSNPQSTAATRSMSYQYLSPALDLPTVITSPSVASGQSKTATIQYTDANHPNLPTVITQSGFLPAGASVSRTVSLGYNAYGQVNHIDGPRTDVSDVTTLVYYDCTTGGACGQLQQVTNALGQVTTYDSYDAIGRLLQMTGPNGLVTTYGYDPRGRVTSITQIPPAGGGTAATWQYSYTPWGDVAQAIDPDGIVLNYGYDAAHYLRTITDGAGNQIRYKYDLKGNRTQDYTYNPGSTLVRQIDIAYDLRNHVSSINAAGSLTQQVYDAVGNLTTEVDPKNNPATTHGYDALNRLTQTLDALSGNTATNYDVNDRISQVTAPNNASTQYSIDDLGNRLQETSSDRGNISYSYDAAGNVLTQTDARGVSVSYAYDALNRLTSVDYPGTAEDVTYTYDTGPNCTAGIGRLCQVVDASGTTQYGYDAFGNITQQRKTELGVTYTTGYSYSAGNRVTAISYPDQRQATYTRDAVGRISGVTATVNGSSQTIVSSRTYRADGLLLTQSYGNGLNESRTYDLQGRLTNQTLGTADTRVYGFDANGNVTSAQNVAQTGSYSYDALDRLVQDSITSTPTSTVNFGYDANGNRTSDGNGTYIYLSASNRLTQYHGQAITLDAAGNTINDGTYTYAYNNAGELQSVSQGATLGSYVYNHLRQRTRKTTGPTTTVYHYDLRGNLILETDASGTSQTAYVWVDNQPLAQITKSGGTDTLSYLHADHEGTPRLATNATKAVVWRYEGRAFGDTAPTGSVTVNLRYPGMYADAETGLYYWYSRYYDPKTGRGISADQMSVAAHVRRWRANLGTLNQPPLELNPYVYVANNPLRWIDPNGLETTVTVWQPVGWGQSSFGHVSTDINGTTYSFGPGGMSVLPTSDYLSKNAFRTGVGAKLNLKTEQETRLQACMSKSRSSFNTVANNCGTPIQDCLKELGYDLGWNLFPVSVGNSLLDYPGLVTGFDFYSATQPAKGTSAPWAK